MAKIFTERGIRIVSGGTDNHIILLDVYGSLGISGKQAEDILECVGISTNKNMIPFDSRKPLDPSGIRLGTPAITTRGFTVEASEELAHIIVDALHSGGDSTICAGIRDHVRTLCEQFPIPLTR